MHLSTYDKFNFIDSLFYRTPFESYVPDFNPTLYIEDRFWTRGQFASQATILGLHTIESRYCINIICLFMSENMLIKFEEEIAEIVRVVAPEITFS